MWESSTRTASRNRASGLCLTILGDTSAMPRRRLSRSAPTPPSHSAGRHRHSRASNVPFLPGTAGRECPRVLRIKMPRPRRHERGRAGRASSAAVERPPQRWSARGWTEKCRELRDQTGSRRISVPALGWADPWSQVTSTTCHLSEGMKPTTMFSPQDIIRTGTEGDNLAVGVGERHGRLSERDCVAGVS